MNVTVDLLATIGYLAANGSFRAGEPRESCDLLAVAKRNKVAALYTHRLAETGELSALADVAAEQRDAFDRFERTIQRVCDRLDGTGADFAVVKTPVVFPANFSDVDVLTDDAGIGVIEAEFAGAGFPRNADSPSAVEFCDPETDYLIDVQNDFTLRQVVYLPRDVVLEHSGWSTHSGRRVRTPDPAVEIPLFVIHALSEQLFTIRDFYHLLSRFHDLSLEGLQDFHEIVRTTGLGGAMGATLPLVAGISNAVFGTVPPQLAAAAAPYPDYGEFDRLQSAGWRMPHRYGTRSLLATLYHKRRDPTFRRSLVTQLEEFRDPRTVAHNVRHFIKRQSRESY